MKCTLKKLANSEFVVNWKQILNIVTNNISREVKFFTRSPAMWFLFGSPSEEHNNDHSLANKKKLQIYYKAVVGTQNLLK